MPNSTYQRVYSRSVTDGGHVLRIDVDREPTHGWRIREERDSKVVRQVTCEDWHRVELTIRGFTAEAAQLTKQGWRIPH